MWSLLRMTNKTSETMKTIILLLSSLFLFGNVFSQKEIKLTAAVSQRIAVDDLFGFVDFNDYQDNFYLGTDFSFGGEFATSGGSIGCTAVYNYGGGLYATPYEFDYHMLGLGLNYRVFNDSKIVSPLIGFVLLTEVKSNYKGKYLEYYRPVDFMSSLQDVRY